MFHNKQTPSEEVKPFKSQVMHPERKVFEKHIPQKLVIRAQYDRNSPSTSDFIGQTGGYVNLKFEVAAKLLENLPDMCYVACEQFTLSEAFASTQIPPLFLNESYNITSPLFSNPYQYISKWSGGGGEYSQIVATIPVNSSTYFSENQNVSWFFDINGNRTTQTPITTSGAVTPGATSAITGSITNTTFNVTAVTGTIVPGQALSAGTGYQAGTVILAQIDGDPVGSTGGAGNYRVSRNYGSTPVAITSGVTSGTQTVAVYGGSGLPPYSSVSASAGYFIAWEQPVLQNQIGCFVVNKQMLNNQTIPFSIRMVTRDQATLLLPAGQSSAWFQMTLVFYGLNDDERYSIIPSV